MLWERGVVCGKRVGINISDALSCTAQKNAPWSEDENWHEVASSITGKEGVHNLKSCREFSRERNKNANTESDPDMCTKEASERASNRTNLNNRNNTANLYKTYSNQKDRYADTKNDNYDRNFVTFQKRCDQIKLKGEDRPEELSIILPASAQVFY